MISTYRRALGLPGALAFSASGLVARLPISMVTLGIVLLVSTRTGSYSLAGSVSAAYLVPNAVCAVPLARLVDRRGQSRVLLPAVLVFGLGLSLMMTAVELGWPTPVPHLFAAVSGAAMPQIGSCVRARWSRIVPDKRLLQTAFAIEAVADETVFIVGPALVTLLATLLHPLAGLGCAVVAALAGTAALVAQKATEPPPSGAGHGGRQAGPIGWWVIGPLTACAFTLGILFGGAEVATVAFAEELGRKPLSGFLLGVWALGSLLAGLVVGAVRLRAGSAARFRWGLLSLALLMTPLPFVQSLWLMTVLLFLAGFAISPTLIASVAWVEETVPSSRITEGIAITTTGLAAGVAPGAAVVGVVIDAYGASVSYWVPAAAGFVGAAVAFTAWPWQRGRTAARPVAPSGSPG
ncbi:MFS transporter [Nocardioides mesophilus]|uniref:MFS transporter n=1 Tax=Nocardioides mesophilus TaxID=433659 RepID=A0A7G9RBL2_9ACTN|nr:MFS transporter [Nocardioides mesophilus]QNN52987.1 MFS transporter [Nocardioides mesophilus]